MTGDISPEARYARRSALYRMTKTALLKLCATGITTPEGRAVALESGNGPLDRQSRAEIIDLILLTEFPFPATKAA